jgi:hypothetical protein
MTKIFKSPWFWILSLLGLLLIGVLALELGPSVFKDTYEVFE